LPRVSINGLFQNETALRALLSGVPFWAWNRSRAVVIASSSYNSAISEDGEYCPGNVDGKEGKALEGGNRC
jgi:hypothetical protein